MTITPEQWTQLSKCDNDLSHLMTARERNEFLRSHASEDDIAKIYDIRSTAGGRRKRKLTSDALTWDNLEHYERPISGRALEDLVLECIDAGIDIDLYL